MNLNLGDTQLIISEAKSKGLLRNQLAYVLATTYHETAHSMKPVREYGGEAYLQKKKYYPYVGMGYVQLTWLANYQKASDKLGVDFVKSPKLLLEPKYAAPILIDGMVEGWFTGKKLSDYITLQKSDFKNARRIINGTDKADLIASYAKQYDADLKVVGYGEEQIVSLAALPDTQQEPTVAKVADILPEPAPDKPLAKSSRFWTWFGSGGGAAIMPFVDWRVQIAIVGVIVAVALYAILTMPQAKAKIQKIIEGF